MRPDESCHQFAAKVRNKQTHCCHVQTEISARNTEKPSADLQVSEQHKLTWQRVRNINPWSINRWISIEDLVDKSSVFRLLRLIPASLISEKVLGSLKISSRLLSYPRLKFFCWKYTTWRKSEDEKVNGWGGGLQLRRGQQLPPVTENGRAEVLCARRRWSEERGGEENEHPERCPAHDLGMCYMIFKE